MNKNYNLKNIAIIIGLWLVVLMPLTVYVYKNLVKKDRSIPVVVKNTHVARKAAEKPHIKPKDVALSQNGELLIKLHESLRLRAYRIKGESSNTIGWGHKINSKDPIYIQRLWVGKRITKAQADELFRKDVKTFLNPALKRLCRELAEKNVHLNQNEIDGLGSLVYNCGVCGVKRTTFYKLLLKGRKTEAVNMVSSTHVYKRGHQSRRELEERVMKGEDINSLVSEVYNNRKV